MLDVWYLFFLVRNIWNIWNYLSLRLNKLIKLNNAKFLSVYLSLSLVEILRQEMAQKWKNGKSNLISFSGNFYGARLIFGKKLWGTTHFWKF